MGAFGTREILLILVAILLLFGAKRLPELARSLGRSMKEFKKGAQDVVDTIESADDESDNDSS